MLADLWSTLVHEFFMFLLSVMPTIDISILPSINIIQEFINVVNGVAYFLPIGHLLTIFGIWITLINWKVLWNVIQRIWDALPFT